MTVQISAMLKSALLILAVRNPKHRTMISTGRIGANQKSQTQTYLPPSRDFSPNLKQDLSGLSGFF